MFVALAGLDCFWLGGVPIVLQAHLQALLSGVRAWTDDVVVAVR